MKISPSACKYHWMKTSHLEKKLTLIADRQEFKTEKLIEKKDLKKCALNVWKKKMK